MEICLVWVFIGRFSFKFIMLERKAGEVRYTVTLGCVLCGCFAKSSAFKGAGQMLAVVCGHTMAADPKKNGWGEEPLHQQVILQKKLVQWPSQCIHTKRNAVSHSWKNTEAFLFLNFGLSVHSCNNVDSSDGILNDHSKNAQKAPC